MLHFYDLESKNVTQQGKLLSRVKKLADGLRPSRADGGPAGLIAFSPSGLLAYVNSNDGDDATLKIIRGVGPAGAAAKKKK